MPICLLKVKLRTHKINIDQANINLFEPTLYFIFVNVCYFSMFCRKLLRGNDSILNGLKN